MNHPDLSSDAATQAARHNVRILESVAPPGQSVKYIDQVVRHAPEHFRFLYFSWLTALTRRYDVFHIHWPEVLVRDRSTLRSAIRLTLAQILLARLRWTRTPIIRTVHNSDPHNKLNRKQAAFLKKVDRATAVFVHLNRCASESFNETDAVVLHGHYRDQFSVYPRAQSQVGRFLVIGRIEPYKGVDRFIKAFAASGEPGEEARIVGSVSAALRPELESQLRDWSREDVELSSRLEFVSDAELVAEITAAQCIVLPYSEMLNSGIALVALSLDRPIIVPRTCVNVELSREAGPGWVIQYDGEFNEAVLVQARQELASERSLTPNLENRSWEHVASAYASVIEEALQKGTFAGHDPSIGHH